MINVRCACGHELGQFLPMDDHSGILMICPHCKQTCEIHNGQLSELGVGSYLVATISE